MHCLRSRSSRRRRPGIRIDRLNGVSVLVLSADHLMQRAPVLADSSRSSFRAKQALLCLLASWAARGSMECTCPISRDAGDRCAVPLSSCSLFSAWISLAFYVPPNRTDDVSPDANPLLAQNGTRSPIRQRPAPGRAPFNAEIPMAHSVPFAAATGSWRWRSRSAHFRRGRSRYLMARRLAWARDARRCVSCCWCRCRRCLQATTQNDLTRRLSPRSTSPRSFGSGNDFSCSLRPLAGCGRAHIRSPGPRPGDLSVWGLRGARLVRGIGLRPADSSWGYSLPGNLPHGSRLATPTGRGGVFRSEFAAFTDNLSKIARRAGSVLFYSELTRDSRSCGGRRSDGDGG
jgi:hypothetical protein